MKLRLICRSEKFRGFRRLGRPRQERIQPALARRFRSVVRQQLRYRGVAQVALLQPASDRKKLRSSFEMRSQRWLFDALAYGKDLKVNNAVEIVARLLRLRVRLPDDLMLKMFPALRRPALIVFEGESALAGKIVAQRVKRLARLSEPEVRRIERDLRGFFAAYEPFNSTPAGRLVLKAVKGYFGERWREHVSEEVLEVKGDSHATRALAGRFERFVWHEGNRP